MFGRATIRLGIGPHSSFRSNACCWRIQFVDHCWSWVWLLCPVELQTIAVSVSVTSVFIYVSLLACLKWHVQIIIYVTKFSVRYLWLWVLLWWQWNMLCTSVLWMMLFAHNGPHGMWQRGNVVKVTHQEQNWGKVLMTVIAFFIFFGEADWYICCKLGFNGISFLFLCFSAEIHVMTVHLNCEYLHSNSVLSEVSRRL